jgi:chemotaxis protein CheD
MTGSRQSSIGRQSERIVVGVADLKVSPGSSGTITTHALGSCIGLTVWDPVSRAGGMLHYMLAQPRDKEKARQNPHMYAVSGVPALFRSMYEMGCVKEKLIVCAAGASEILDDQAGFSIGKRNRTILRKLFWKNGIVLHAEDTGGSVARHMTLDLETGRVALRIKNEEIELWRP